MENINNEISIELFENQVVTTSSTVILNKLRECEFTHSLLYRDYIMIYLKSVLGTIPAGASFVINFYNDLFGLLGSETITYGTIPAGVSVTCKYYNELFGLLDSEILTFTQIENTNYTKLECVSDKLLDADYFTIDISLPQASGSNYSVSMLANVKKKIDEDYMSVNEAPLDNKSYIRKNGTWEELVNSAVGDMLTSVYDPAGKAVQLASDISVVHLTGNETV